jgi:hypothetical protein
MGAKPAESRQTVPRRGGQHASRLMSEKGNPGALAAARAPERFCSAAKTFLDNNEPLLAFQAQSIARRFGVRPSIARLVVSLAFAEVRP